MRFRLISAGLGLWLVVCLITLNAAPSMAQGGDDQNVTMLAAGNNAFGFKMYHAIRATEKGNLFFSPYSVVEALSMTLNGATGKTRDQMVNTLGFALNPDEINAAILALRATMTKRGNSAGSQSTPATEPARALNIANSLFGEQTFPFRESFLSQVKTFYGAGLQKVDFIGAPEAARKQINDWVAQQTADKIKNIVPEGVITPDTRLALANAIYFLNSWTKPFMETETKDDTFNMLDGKSVPVKMMHRQEMTSYFEGAGFQAVELPYSGFGSMLLIVPDAGKFETVEKSLDAVFLKRITDGPTTKMVDLAMPRFKFDYALDLSAVLKQLGMVDAFDATKADFSGMVDAAASNTNRLAISNVLHKAFIDLNERGTEAAAATVVVMSVTAIQVPSDVVTVRIDRPFFFAIRDSQSGTVLFMGSVLDPSA